MNETTRNETGRKDIISPCRMATHLRHLGYGLEAQELNPKDVKIHNNLGVVYARQGRMMEAVIQFKNALRIDPDDLLARDNLAKALPLTGRNASPAKETEEIR